MNMVRATLDDGKQASILESLLDNRFWIVGRTWAYGLGLKPHQILPDLPLAIANLETSLALLPLPREMPAEGFDGFARSPRPDPVALSKANWTILAGLMHHLPDYLPDYAVDTNLTSQVKSAAYRVLVMGAEELEARGREAADSPVISGFSVAMAMAIAERFVAWGIHAPSH